MKKWEYFCVPVKEDKAPIELIGILDSYGTDGWELMSIVPKYSSGGYLERHTFYFKRPLVEKSAEPVEVHKPVVKVNNPPMLGDESNCRSCGKPIYYNGVMWAHSGTTPRHPALPEKVA